MLFLDQLAQQGNHDDGGGQVVQRGRKEEGNETDHPQQVHALAGADAVGDDLEAFVGVDQLDDGHGAHQEEQDLRHFTEVVAQFGRDFVARGFSQERQDAVGPQHQYRPTDDGGEDGRGGLVDFQGVFEGDA
ncbi:hypothetical protein D3C84_732360 [compost metagenome]